MALSPIEMVRVITQDNGKLPFLRKGDYILSNEEVDMYLTLSSSDVMKAARLAAYAISLWVSGVNTKEVSGQVEVWNDVSKNYLKALNAFMTDATVKAVFPKGLMPYAAGTSVADLAQSIHDLDNPNIYNWLYRTPNTNCDNECIDDNSIVHL